MDAYALLGLATDADEIAIKRAYARRLKTTRPDDDPDGFQRLHEAYQHALQRSRARASRDDDTAIVESDWDGAEDADAPALEFRFDQRQLQDLLAGSGDADAPAGPRSTGALSPDPAPAVDTETTASAASRFDFDGFLAEAVQRANNETPAALAAWLAGHAGLYHLRLKQSVGEALFQRIVEDDILLPLDSLSAFGGFFDIETDWLSRRMAVRWAIRREHTAAYDEPRPLAIRQLKREFSPVQAVLMSCIPGISARIARLGERLLADHGDLPAGINPAQVRFFGQLARKDYLGTWRWLPILLRTALIALLGYLLAPLVFAQARDSLATAMWLGGIALVAQLAGRLMTWLHTISIGTAPQARGWRGLLPLWMALAGLALAALLPFELPAYLLVVPAALLHWRRSFDALRFLLGGFAMQPALPAELQALAPAGVLGFAMVPIGLALFDGLHARYHGIPLAAAAGNRWTTIASYGFFVGWLLIRVMQGTAG